MGVSLERVQFKFASIIGELCSEPDVLSQFAVWLDLRLAEYKLKGNISLDCSGEEPDPIWLKGLNKGHKRKGRRSPKMSPQPKQEDLGSLHMDPTSDNRISERLSPEVVLVKEDPDEIYPVDMLMNVQGNPRHNLKRPSQEPSVSYSEQWSPTPKQRRLSENQEPVSNQSLMSVLGEYQEDQQTDVQTDNQSVFPTTTSIDHHDNSMKQFDKSSPSSSQYTSTPYRSQMLQHGDPNTSNEITWREPKGNAHPTEATLVQEVRQAVISKLDQTGMLPRQSLSNMLSSVYTIQSWLWKKYETESRVISDIPPEQLDQYLADFFTTITKESGNDYSRETFCSLRSHIDRYLKLTGYDHPVSRSPLFVLSQEAYKLRYFSLKVGRVKRVPQPFIL